ncbi:helix-turn-helix domain-containing protein [Terrisporobacter sp.]
MNKWIDYIVSENSKNNKLTKKQENILVSAVELISEKGYERVSTAEIAKKQELQKERFFVNIKLKRSY